MRIAATIAEDDKGKWHAVFLPPVDPKVQRIQLKDLVSSKGKMGKGKDAVQYVRALIFESGGQIKRKRFTPEVKAAKPVAE